MKDNDEYQKQQDEQLKKKETELQEATENLKISREKLNKIIGEKGKLEGALKLKQERFDQANGELLKNLEKIFREMQDEFEDPYRMKSIFMNKNGQGAYILISKTVEEFKIKRDKIIHDFESKNKEVDEIITKKEKEANVIETQLEMQKHNLQLLEGRFKNMKEEEENSKENTNELDNIHTDLQRIHEKL